MKTTCFKTITILVLSLFFLNCSGPEPKIIVNKDVSKKLSNHSELNLLETDNFVVITPTDSEHAKKLKNEISHLSHENGKCGGFTESSEEELERISSILKEQNTLNNSYDESLFKSPVFNEDIAKVNDSLSVEKLKASVGLLVSQGTRSAKAKNPNKPIAAFIEHIKNTLKKAKLSYKVERVSHKTTKQDSIKVRVEGFDSPEQIVVLGGHIDSRTSFFSNKAPGADDNASGSSVILEVLRALLESDYKPRKSLEFFWYAGEEDGLLGSKEIARSYRDKNIDVVGVMQLDMVLFPGNGGKIGFVTDYTNVEVTSFVEGLTKLYVQDGIERFKCGYGCSDHASWHQNGFKAVAPFEATSRTINRNIHTERDVVDNRSSFDHALKFAKIALAFLVEYSS